MSVCFDDVTIAGDISFSPDDELTSYIVSYPQTIESGTRVSFVLPDTQGEAGQLLYCKGDGETVWLSQEEYQGRSSGVGRLAVFSTSFTANNSSEYLTYSGTGSDKSVCKFVYPGLSVIGLTGFSVIMAMGGASTTYGTIKLKNKSGDVVASIYFNSTDQTPQIYSTSDVDVGCLPKTQEIMLIDINIATPTSRKVNLFSLTVN